MLKTFSKKRCLLKWCNKDTTTILYFVKPEGLKLIINANYLFSGHNWVSFPTLAIVYCYLEFKLYYLKNLILELIQLDYYN